jgi:hypothetical protein
MVTLARTALTAAILTACTTTPPPNHLALANGNLIRVVDTPGGAVLQDVRRYTEVFDLGFRDDGGPLALADCFRNRVVELDATAAYAERGAPIAASSCPWDLAYSPDGQSLAAVVLARPSPPDALFDHLRIAGPQPLDRDLGLPLRALAWRRGGGQFAVARPQGVEILGPAPAHGGRGSRARRAGAPGQGRAGRLARHGRAGQARAEDEPRGAGGRPPQRQR